MKQPCVGGSASISAVLVFQQAVCDFAQMFGAVLAQITSNKAKNQCRNMDTGGRLNA
jgi:hypothetical protein